MKRYLLLLLALCVLCLTPGCSTAGDTDGTKGPALDYEQWDTVLSAAEGTSVTFYGWGGNELVNDWIDDTLIPYCQETYGITVERVAMDIDMILNKLSGNPDPLTALEGTDLCFRIYMELFGNFFHFPCLNIEFSLKNVGSSEGTNSRLIALHSCKIISVRIF